MACAALSIVLLIGFMLLQAVTGDNHSLFYLYTIQSKTSDSKLYDCTAVTLLNNRQIDFYNSSSVEIRTPKQTWLKNIPESDWKTSTEKLQYDTQLLNRLIYKQMDEFGDSESDGHVLQWRHGCEGERRSDGSVTVLNSINEFGYDGEDLIQFNCNSKTWLTPEKKKNREREETWSKLYDAVKKCLQCEVMLKMYSQFNTTDITPSNTPPAVHIFAKQSVHDSSKLKLTCLATGFYPKDVEISLRKFTTSIPDHLLTYSEVRPNDDGTYQLRKSVKIPKDDSADYYCYVNHSSLREPVIKQWENSSSLGVIIGVGVTVLVVILSLVIFWVLKRKEEFVHVRSPKEEDSAVTERLKSNGSPRCNGHAAASEGKRCTDCSDSTYLGLIIGGVVLVALGVLILCVLIGINRGGCTDCSDSTSPGLIIGILVTGGVVLLCLMMLCVLIAVQ